MQTYSETRFGCSEPVIVTDTDTIYILEELFGFVSDQLVKAFGAVLLHSLKAHNQVYG